MVKMSLIQGDCLKVLPTIPDNSIDLVLTDPPYNISRETNFDTMEGHRGTSMDFGEWDKDADITSFIGLLPRILKKGANVVIFNCWENIGMISKELEKKEITPKRCLVLNKSNPAPFNIERLFVNDVEFAIWGIYKNDGWTFNRQEKYEKCVLDTQVQSKEYHPTMKDMDVMEKIIKILSNPNNTVLDCFAGSGTIMIASRTLRRNCISIEIDPKYIQTIKNRMGWGTSLFNQIEWEFREV